MLLPCSNYDKEFPIRFDTYHLQVYSKAGMKWLSIVPNYAPHNFLEWGPKSIIKTLEINPWRTLVHEINYSCIPYPMWFFDLYLCHVWWFPRQLIKGCFEDVHVNVYICQNSIWSIPETRVNLELNGTWPFGHVWGKEFN